MISLLLCTSYHISLDYLLKGYRVRHFSTRRGSPKTTALFQPIVYKHMAFSRNKFFSSGGTSTGADVAMYLAGYLAGCVCEPLDKIGLVILF